MRSSSLGQVSARVRLDWGPAAVRETVHGADLAVVVDVLSFTTTVSVALDGGAEVHPYQWADDTAAEYARAHQATLAVGRLEARDSGNVASVSLSPATIRSSSGLSRLVLPSPNGSTISARLAEGGAGVVAASLRNRSAVAEWLTDRLHADPSSAVTVIAAGERWPDGSLRPAVEDLWGAGSVIAALGDHGVSSLSPEAATAVAAFDSVWPGIDGSLLRCASGRELAEKGFEADVLVAAEVDMSACVPLLRDGRFVDAAA
ncbi:2-phosphosulfolactate phosphatase [Haloactinopolyspora alba]|uniref:Probable 2-phosphosulfolactate phosphatase n=1 Tax=Haloactinopolyspora alba TaxID=648780 RepID=A0A2P8EGC3_9ACTN|nr:2-phosphosulfolactate phosphatase [Haloactinopolyspora alba]